MKPSSADAVDDQVVKALGGLRDLINSRVRVEQLVDQMTKLANGSALSETILHRLKQPDGFWVAFIEVDGFKSINQIFGYDRADELLRWIADLLRHMSGYFPGITEPFRAHGDEFYLLGVPDGNPNYNAEAIEKQLKLLSTNVASKGIFFEGLGEMRCTVSIGWLMSLEVPEILDVREILACLERAVIEAKHKQGQTVKYTRALAELDQVDWRTKCPECHCGFSIVVERDVHKPSEQAHCPNCGAKVTRPPEKQKPAKATPPTMVLPDKK